MKITSGTAQEDIPLDPHSLIRIGVIVSVDLAQARCVVRVGDPDNDAIETPPIRWLAARAGETRTWSPPSVGEQVILLCAGGELAAGVAMTGIVSDNFSAPGSDSTELISFGDGAQLAYDPVNHHLMASLPAGSSVDIEADSIRLTGNVEIEGDLAVSGTIAGDTDVTAGPNNISLKDHVHTGVSTGAGISGKPQS